MATVPVFVYGTLRTGEYNYRVVEDAVSRVDEDATIRGHVWFVGRFPGGYPVCKVTPTSPDKVVGDILWCDNEHEAYTHMVRMEVGAGYEMILTEATLPNGNTVDVYVFNYLGECFPNCFIEDGDWRRAYREINEQRSSL